MENGSDERISQEGGEASEDPVGGTLGPPGDGARSCGSSSNSTPPSAEGAAAVAGANQQRGAIIIADDVEQAAATTHTPVVIHATSTAPATVPATATIPATAPATAAVVWAPPAAAPPRPILYPVMGASYGPHVGVCRGIYCTQCYKYGCMACGARSNRFLAPCWSCGSSG